MSLQKYPAPTYLQRLKIALQYLMPQQPLTRLAGWLAERRWGGLTHIAIQIFAARYRIDWHEAACNRPADYATFNEFFMRRLKDGARPIDNGPRTLCLPADGKISEAGKIEQGRLLQAKGRHFSLNALLAGDAALTAQLDGGQFLTTYLSPRDYHRIHMPCDAVLRRMIYVPGELFSVNPFLAAHIPDLFARNERVICVFDTEFGTMVQILVGATITASISTAWAGVINPPRTHEVREWHYGDNGASPIRLQKGQEMGAFRLGSTVINLFPADTVRLNARLTAGTQTRMGEAMAERI
ncbi:MAG: archaetidylserine decarboxylase [Neisseria sp.]|nr:archaetidylserine decarboxylase [Neisseria sp.]